jgi:hypothetical protein
MIAKFLSKVNPEKASIISTAALLGITLWAGARSPRKSSSDSSEKNILDFDRGSSSTPEKK